MTGLLVWASDVEVTDTPGGSPGFIGFVFTFLLAAAAVLLFLSLTKHLRIVDRRSKELGLDDDEPGTEPGGTEPGGTEPGGTAPVDAASDASSAGAGAAGGAPDPAADVHDVTDSGPSDPDQSR